MTPVKAVQTCFRKYATFSGRAPRSEFWWFILFGGVVNLVAESTLGPGGPSQVVELALALPGVAVCARRMQDADQRGEPIALLLIGSWIASLFLWGLTPPQRFPSSDVETLLSVVVGAGLLWGLFWWCRRGTVGPNRFGPDPLAADAIEMSTPLPAAVGGGASDIPESPLDDAVAQVTQKAGTVWSKLLKEVRTDEVERAALQRGQRSLPLHVAPPVITLLGGALVLVSMFLPALADPNLNTSGLIRNNLMVESHPIFLFCTVASIVSAIRYWQVGSKSSAQIAIGAGALLLAFVVFDAETSLLVDTYGHTREANAGAGLWMAAIGSTVVAFGGLMMRFPHYSFGLIGPMIEPGEKQSVYQTKICPRCAETIKAGAVVCRFCNYDFPRDTASGR